MASQPDINQSSQSFYFVLSGGLLIINRMICPIRFKCKCGLYETIRDYFVLLICKIIYVYGTKKKKTTIKAKVEDFYPVNICDKTFLN